MSKVKTGEDRFLCHLFEVQDAKEANKRIGVTKIKSYGGRLLLDDNTVLHDNYPHRDDEGGRYLFRCKECGALTLMQSSMSECPYWDDPDLYYHDIIPVVSMEEADLLNILWDENEFKEYPFRHLRRDDRRIYWTEGNEPVPYEPEELRGKIREKYAGLSTDHKQMLEELMSAAGKEKDAGD